MEELRHDAWLLTHSSHTLNYMQRYEVCEE